MEILKIKNFITKIFIGLVIALIPLQVFANIIPLNFFTRRADVIGLINNTWDFKIGSLSSCDSLKTDSDGLFSCGTAGAGYTNLTEFVDQTAWRLFYSDASGDVTELALGADGTYLKSSGVSVAPIWDSPSGAGDVVGSATSTDNAIVRFDETTGKLIQNSLGIISDTGLLSGLTNTNWDDSYSKRVDTWGDGLQYSSQTASIDFNVNNLKITSTELDTIQGISTSSTPEFTGLNLTDRLDLNNNEIINVDYFDFNTTSTVATQEGRIWWSEDDKTLNVGTENGDVVLQVGQEQHIRATNKTESQINNGQVVYVSTAIGNRPVISLAKADTYNTSHTTIGIATHDIADNATGYITTFGLVRDINTDPGTYTAGEELWLGVMLFDKSVNFNAEGIKIYDSAGYFTGTELESVLAEVGLTRVTSWTSPLAFSSNTASITQADTSTDGYLNSTDWNLFNNKVTESTTISDSDRIDFTLSTYDITADIKTDSINDTFIDWGTGANQVSALDIPITDTTDYFVGTEIETALSELGRDNAYADSPGIMTGGVITEGTNAGTFKVAALTALFRTTDSVTAPLKYAILTEQDNQTITATSISLNYNSGSPTITLSETNPYALAKTNIPIGKVMKDTFGNVHYISGGYDFQDGVQKLHTRAVTLRNLELSSGSTIAYSGTNNFTMTSGIVFGGINMFIPNSYDSATTTFIPVYQDSGSGWTEGTPLNVIDYEHYDDGDGTLGTVGVAKYGTHWVYKHIDDEDVYVVYGRGSYSLAEAEEEGEPTRPDQLTEFGVLIGKIVAPQAGGSFTTIQMVTDKYFSGTAVADHNELGTLQGGIADEYYHLTSAQHTIATQPADTTNSGYLSTTDWDTFNDKITESTTISDTNSINLTLTTYDITADVLTQNSTTIDLSIDASGLKADLDTTLKSNYDSAYTHIGESGASHTYIDQSVISGATPIFGIDNFTDGGGLVLITGTQETNFETAYTNRITSATSPLDITANVVSISQADTDTSGYLSDTDWDTFNNKASSDTFAGFEVDGVSQTAIAPIFDFDGTTFSIVEDPADNFDININKGNLTEATSTVLTITGGSSAILSNTTIEVDTDLSNYNNSTSAFITTSALTNYMQDEDINTFSELQSWVTDATLTKTATTTDTKYCTWNATASAIQCEAEGGAGATQLSDLSDVGVTTPTDKNALMADGDSWESRALVEADISDLGTYLTDITGESLFDLSDVAVDPNADRFLMWDDDPGTNVWHQLVEADISDFGTYALIDQTFYIGTTAVDINRTSATLNLAGIGTLGVGSITSSGTLILGANDITMTGSLADTTNRVLKGWFTDLEVTNDITIGGTALASVYAPIDSPTFTTAVTVPANSISASELDEGDDFIFTSSLAIPQGDPTIDSAGEIGIDTTSDQFLYYGASERVLTYETEKCFTVASTTADVYDDIPLWSPKHAITVTDIYCRAEGGTSYAVTCGDGTNYFEEIVCGTAGTADDGSITNASFTANERFECDFGTNTGEVNFVNYCITYTIDAD